MVNTISDTNPELPDKLGPEMKEYLAEREASDVSVKELVENGKIIMVRGKE